MLQHVLEKVDPDFVEGYFYMANNWAYLEEYELAEECVLRYLEADENGEYREEAEEMLQMISELLGRPPRTLRPRKEWMLHNIHDKARRLLEEGRFAEATQLLERIVAEEPSFTAARNNLTLAYFYQGRLEEAFRSYTRFWPKIRATFTPSATWQSCTGIWENGTDWTTCWTV